MSNWIARTGVTGIQYGQAQDQYYWYYPANPGAYYDPGIGTYDLALPNCTTYAWGRILEAGDPTPITGWHNAAAWHSHLTNGWTAIAYNFSDLAVGDIVEWCAGTHNHVAVVESIEGSSVYVSQSYYRDTDGGVTGTRDPAICGSTKTSVNAWGISTYPNQYFNYGNILSAYGVLPDYILKNPGTHPNFGAPLRWFGSRKTIRRRRIYV